MNDYYKHKYLKYKYKYIQLEHQYQVGGKKEKFYFVHFTKDINSILKILKDGYIHPGKKVPKKYRYFGDPDGMEDIYANIYFEDLDNLHYLPNYSLIINPDIIKTHNIVFHKGWGGGLFGKTITIKKNQQSKTKNKKIKEIKDWLKNIPRAKNITDHQYKFIKKKGMYQQEALFDESINVDNYVIGIICVDQNKNKVKKLNKLLQKYPDIKLITKYKGIPKLKYFIK